MKIPLSKQLKKRVHLELAMLQDEVMDIIYSLCRNDPPVLHGGTAIWRCYDGKRFSEDLDFYGSLEKDFKEKLRNAVNARGFVLEKYKQTNNTVFAKISNGATVVKLEIALRKAPEKTVKHYEKTDGSVIDIYTLSAETLIIEKINAYNGRRYIRDIYDVYYLSSFTEKIDRKIMQRFIDNIEMPIDEKNLRTLIYSGVAPSFEQIVSALKR